MWEADLPWAEKPMAGLFLIAAGQLCVSNVASPIPSAPSALAAIRTAACRIRLKVKDYDCVGERQ